MKFGQILAILSMFAIFVWGTAFTVLPFTFLLLVSRCCSYVLYVIAENNQDKNAIGELHFDGEWNKLAEWNEKLTRRISIIWRWERIRAIKFGIGLMF